jgi:hypothetical protein
VRQTAPSWPTPKNFKPTILVYPDREPVCFSNFDRQEVQTMRNAPVWSLVNLPGMTEGAIVT